MRKEGKFGSRELTSFYEFLFVLFIKMRFGFFSVPQLKVLSCARGWRSNINACLVQRQVEVDSSAPD